jgi:hypothetical protein
MFSQQLKRLVGPALAVSGLLWIIVYIVIVIIGLETGKLAPPLDAHSTALVRIGIWLLPLSLLPLYTGLLGVFARLEGRASGLGITGVVFASIGLVLAVIDLIVLSGLFGYSDFLNSNVGGFGAFSMIIGTGFLGVAALRARLQSIMYVLPGIWLSDGP